MCTLAYCTNNTMLVHWLMLVGWYSEVYQMDQCTSHHTAV